MTSASSKAPAKAPRATPKRAAAPRRSPKPQRHCSGAGIVDVSGRWQLRLEDY